MSQLCLRPMNPLRANSCCPLTDQALQGNTAFQTLFDGAALIEFDDAGLVRAECGHSRDQWSRKLIRYGQSSKCRKLVAHSVAYSLPDVPNFVPTTKPYDDR